MSLIPPTLKFDPDADSRSRLNCLRRRAYGVRRSPIILAALAIVMCGFLAPRLQAEPLASQEYEVKAALLVRFAQFVEWPASAFANPEMPISIGVLGDDPFGPTLDGAIQGETAHNRKFQIRRSKNLDELKTCHILFISKSMKDQIPQVFNTLGNSPILTLGESDGFAGRGGIVNFFIEANKVRFEINADTAQRKGLKISSQLLKRAKVVGSDPGKGRE